MSAGVTVYGNGGMNTNYQGGQLGNHPICSSTAAPPNRGFNPGATTSYNMLCGSGNLGINLVDANRQLGSLQLGLWCFLGMDTP